MWGNKMHIFPEIYNNNITSMAEVLYVCGGHWPITASHLSFADDDFCCMDQSIIQCGLIYVGENFREIMLLLCQALDYNII